MPNLVPIPANAFSAGAVKLDNAQIDHALMQNNLMKQQAANFALDKYFDKLDNQLTPTGMDMQNDGKGFMDRKSAWEDHWMQNRAAIMNPKLDGGKAKIADLALFNEARMYNQKSINKVNDLKKIQALRSDPSKSSLVTDQAIDMFNKASLGIDNGYVPIDWSHPIFNPKPWS
jgi:hypothetical protein